MLCLVVNRGCRLGGRRYYHPSFMRDIGRDASLSVCFVHGTLTAVFTLEDLKRDQCAKDEYRYVYGCQWRKITSEIWRHINYSDVVHTSMPFSLLINYQNLIDARVVTSTSQAFEQCFGRCFLDIPPTEIDAFCSGVRRNFGAETSILRFSSKSTYRKSIN